MMSSAAPLSAAAADWAAPAGSRASAAGREAPFDIEMVRIGAQSLRVGRRAGSGVPLLMFNWIGANIEIFAPLAPLMRGRELITFDVPGVGHSALPPWPYRMRHIERLGV
jgi:pimeloyl-ACP methyl ester carboxylesterase